MHTLSFVIGASGSGKTAAVRELERHSGVRAFYFDGIGVPSEQERQEKWGNSGGWQRAATIEWVRRIRPPLVRGAAVLDGQTRPSFIAEACQLSGVTNYRIVLVTCSDDIRRARLCNRGQPELANVQMMEWAKYLIVETQRVGGTVIDNDRLSIAQTAAALARIVGERAKEANDSAGSC